MCIRDSVYTTPFSVVPIFFFNDTAPTEIYTLSLHDALPISDSLPESERPPADVVIARFLKEIGTDYLDLVLLHCVTSPKWPEQLRPYMDSLDNLKSKGVIRAHGVSCHSVAALQTAAAEPWVDSVHARINPYGMSMDDKPEKVVPVLKQLRAAGKGVVGMKIIGEGRLRNDPDKRDASARFVL